MDLSLVVVFVLGTLITPLITGCWILWVERETRAKRRTIRAMKEQGYEMVSALELERLKKLDYWFHNERVL